MALVRMEAIGADLRQDLADHFPCHVGQAVVPALEFVGKPFVVDAEAM
jgi:hypothetical protein